jgi:hypothetical protein
VACPARPASVEEDVDHLLYTPEGRRSLTREPGGDGLGWYAHYYLGLATPDCHRRWYNAFDLARRLLFLAPRSHGKSISAGRVLVGHSIVTNRNIRILLVGKTKSSAAKTARLVRRDLEKNERIREDWQAPEAGGPFHEKGLSWTDSFFYVRRSRDARDPTVEAVGVGGSITGGRFDLIVLDDPVDDRNTMTAAQRKKLREWFYGTVLELLDDNGRAVVIGTRKHADDLYNTLFGDPTFHVVCDKAVLAWPDMAKVQWVEQVDERTGRRQLVDVIVPDGQGEVLWPEKWSIKSLLLKLRSMGSVLFNRENQNEIVDDGTSPFKLAWLGKAKHRGATWGFLPWGMHPETGEVHPRIAEHTLIVWQCVDLSLVDDPEKAAEQHSDWTAIETWGLDWLTGDRYLLRGVRRQGLTQGEMMGLIRTEAALFPQSIGLVLEVNAFGKLYQMGLRRETGLPVHGHVTDRRKHDLYEGVPAMSSLYENDKVVLPYANGNDLAADEIDPRPFVDVFVQEHHGLGKEPHDDTVMCAWVGDVWIRRWIRLEEVRRKRAA